MLLPYMNEPATGSLIPSISTGGAAINATMKHAAAASKHGIMSTPNQPTYKRLLVEVTHSQNSGHPCSRPVDLPVLERVVIRTFVSRTSRVDVKLISSNPSLLDKRRSIIVPIGLGLRALVARVTIVSSPS